MMTMGPSKGRNGTHKLTKADLNELYRSSEIRHAAVYDVTVSLTTKSNCCCRLITSAAKEKLQKRSQSHLEDHW